MSFQAATYVLNIGIKGLERSKFWIRADYIRVYNYLETINDGTSEAEGVAPGAIITGQPGIGEFVGLHTLTGCRHMRPQTDKPLISEFLDAKLMNSSFP